MNDEAVLIVDDEPTTHNTEQGAGGSLLGHAPPIRANGRSRWPSRTLVPDLVLLDVEMPVWTVTRCSMTQGESRPRVAHR